MRRSVHGLRQVATLAKEYNQVPTQVQRHLELIRKCNDDLRQLIQFRDDYAAILGKSAGALERIDHLISNAHSCLDGMIQQIESCRPQEPNGGAAFRNRMKWVLVHSPDFQDQMPTVSRLHANILDELDSLRQTVLMATFDREERPKEEPREETTQKDVPVVDVTVPPVFKNLTLLNDLMGDASGTFEVHMALSSVLAFNTSAAPVQNINTDPAPAVPIENASPKIPSTDADISKNNYVLCQTAITSEVDLTSMIEPKIPEASQRPHSTSEPRRAFKYCDEKEVVRGSIRHHRRLASERIDLGTPDSIGLSILFGDETSLKPTSDLQPPPRHSLVSSVSQVSLVSTNQSLDPSRSPSPPTTPRLRSSVLSAETRSSGVSESNDLLPMISIQPSFSVFQD
jgi:hypothetical protein